MTDEVKIFVYGSCHFLERLDNDQVVGNGGYGVIVNINGKNIGEIAGGYCNTTNARMDIIGITKGLRSIKVPSNITIYLSNGYVIDTLTKGWLEKWKKTGFKKKKHADLWIELDEVINANSHTISFKHIKEITFSEDFQRAEKLAKLMSVKLKLPKDMKIGSNSTSIFEADKLGNDNHIEAIGVIDDKPILDSICVDASTLQNPGPTEYRGVDTQTKKILFSMKYNEATNNIGEFLAIVHALALYQKNREKLNIIYSDSLIAISWVKQKKCKTKYQQTERNTKVFEHIQRAVSWLEHHEYDTKVLKWNTVAWGEIPADYGRK
jgi:ribonuclease HI